MPKSPAVFRTSSELQEVRHASFKLVFYLSRKRSLSFNYHSGVGSRFLSIVQKTVVVTSALPHPNVNVAACSKHRISQATSDCEVFGA